MTYNDIGILCTLATTAAVVAACVYLLILWLRACRTQWRTLIHDDDDDDDPGPPPASPGPDHDARPLPGPTTDLDRALDAFLAATYREPVPAPNTDTPAR